VAAHIIGVLHWRSLLTSNLWRGCIEHIRGSVSDSALENLARTRVIAMNEARLFVTTCAFLEYACVRDLADLPPLDEPDNQKAGLFAAG